MYTHTHPHSHSLARHQTHTRSIIRWLPRRRSKGARCCTTPPWWFCILMVPFLFPLHPSFPSAGNSGGEASVCLTAGRPSDTITVQPFPEYITCTGGGGRRGDAEMVRVHAVGGSGLLLHQNKQHGITEDSGWTEKAQTYPHAHPCCYCEDFHRLLHYPALYPDPAVPKLPLLGLPQK